MRSICLLSLLTGVLCVLPASGQDKAPPPADTTMQASASPAAEPQDTTPAPAAATPAAAPTWSAGPIDFSGTIDAYYSFNFNHPASQQNVLYNFDLPTNQFSLNMAKLGMSHAPDPVGFEFDFMYGNTNSLVPNTFGIDQYVEQAYVSLKPARAHGFELDFGKFVTSAGAEVIESYSNWNYSRSLLFVYAIPLYHFGVRTSWPMGKHLTGGFQVVNGWNDTVDNNTGKTLGANIAITYPKFTLIENWYGGPENFGTNTGWRNLFDTVLTLTPSSKFGMYVNYDYGQNGNPDGSLIHWQGIAGAFHFQATPKWAFTPRIEWFNDPNGAVFGDGRQSVEEVTATGEYKLMEGLLWRAEYRYDWSGQNTFLRGASYCVDEEETFECDVPNAKNQSTITIALVAFFGPKR